MGGWSTFKVNIIYLVKISASFRNVTVFFVYFSELMGVILTTASLGTLTTHLADMPTVLQSPCLICCKYTSTVPSALKRVKN